MAGNFLPGVYGWVCVRFELSKISGLLQSLRTAVTFWHRLFFEYRLVNFRGCLPQSIFTLGILMLDGGR